MLEQMIKSVLNKAIAQDYPHLAMPPVIYATVAGVQKLADTYNVSELEITDEDGGRTFKASYKAPWYEYTLTVVDRFGNVDDKYPELPGIRSKTQFQIGATVAVGLSNGDVAPAIIGEVVL